MNLGGTGGNWDSDGENWGDTGENWGDIGLSRSSAEVCGADGVQGHPGASSDHAG